ncbi:unnamed protein product, partial [Allacma fusca]
LVTTLLPFALGGDNLNCSKIIKREEICCDGDVYSIVEPIWPEESCNVEPKNETLTFADSAWLAFDFFKLWSRFVVLGMEFLPLEKHTLISHPLNLQPDFPACNIPES